MLYIKTIIIYIYIYIYIYIDIIINSLTNITTKIIGYLKGRNTVFLIISLRN